MWQRASQGGGGVDISDLIGNTYGFVALTTQANYQILLAGINSAEFWTAANYTVNLYTDSAATNLLATIRGTTPQTLDVSNINVLWTKAAPGSNKLSIKVLS